MAADSRLHQADGHKAEWAKAGLWPIPRAPSSLPLNINSKRDLSNEKIVDKPVIIARCHVPIDRATMRFLRMITTTRLRAPKS